MSTDARPCDRSVTSTIPDRPCTPSQELNVMLLHEILARTRMREDQHRAGTARLARRLTAIHRWQRFARYADRRAAQLQSRL